MDTAPAWPATGHWSAASTVYRIWRAGNRWRIEQAFDPVGQLRLQEEGRGAHDADPAKWWLAKVDQLRFAPLTVSDGKDDYRFKLAFKDGITAEIASVKKERPVGFPDDLMPRIEALPEFRGHPPMGFPSPDVEAKFDPKPASGPRDTVLIEVQYTGTDPNLAMHFFSKSRYWVDPLRNHLVMRTEMVRTREGVEKTDVYVIEKVARSPRGFWYPTEIRRLNAIRHQDGKQEDQVFRYYLDFDALIPDSIFQAN